MESHQRQPRRIVIWLVGLLVLLAAVRWYHDYLIQHTLELQSWFAVDARRGLALMGLACVTSSLVSWLVVRHSGRRLVVTAAIAAGAMTTAPHTSMTGMVIGLVIGLLFAVHRLRRFAIRAGRWTVTQAFPVLIIAIPAGLLARAIWYSGSPRAKLLSLLVHLAAVCVVLGIAMWRIRRRGVGSRQPERSTVSPVRPAPRWKSVVGAAYRFSMVMCVLLVGIPLGWQADVWRRTWILEQVGDVVHWNPMNPSKLFGLTGIRSPRDLLFWPWWIGDVYLDESATDVHLSYLPGLPNLRGLGIHRSQITDEGCRQLARLRDVAEMSFDETAIGDEGFRHIAGLPNLTLLRVERTQMTRDSLRVLATLPRLRWVHFTGVAPEGTGFGGVALPAALQSLSLEDCGVTDDDVAALAPTTFLWHLSLRGNNIQGPGLTHLARHSRLTTLDLGDNPLDERYLGSLSSLTLSGLEIDGVRLGTVGCEAILRQRWLQDLSVRRSLVTDAQLRKIAASTILQDASLDGTKLTSRGMLGWRQRDVTIYMEDQVLEARDLARLADLDQDVYLVDCELTPGAVAEFANHPSRIFTLSNCRTQGRFVEYLAPYGDVTATD